MNMSERFLIVWFIMVFICIITEVTRWIRKPKEFRWKLYNIDSWLFYNQFIIVMTMIVTALFLMCTVVIYIIDGKLIFLN